MIEQCCEFLTSNIKSFNYLDDESKDTWIYSIDVALNNFSISCENTKKNLRINFGSLQTYQKMLVLFLRQIVEKSLTKKIILKSEKQISRATKNLRLEYFLRGVAAALTTPDKSVIYKEYSPKKKVIFAAEKLGWSYEKIRSKKKFILLTNSTGPLKNLVDGWVCAFCDIKGVVFKIFNNQTSQKKFDDFIDTLIILNDK